MVVLTKVAKEEWEVTETVPELGMDIKMGVDIVVKFNIFDLYFKLNHLQKIGGHSAP